MQGPSPGCRRTARAPDHRPRHQPELGRCRSPPATPPSPPAHPHPGFLTNFPLGKGILLPKGVQYSKMLLCLPMTAPAAACFTPRPLLVLLRCRTTAPAWVLACELLTCTAGTQVRLHGSLQRQRPKAGSVCKVRHLGRPGDVLQPLVQALRVVYWRPGARLRRAPRPLLRGLKTALVVAAVSSGPSCARVQAQSCFLQGGAPCKEANITEPWLKARRSLESTCNRGCTLLRDCRVLEECGGC